MILLYRLFYLPAFLFALPYYVFRMWRRGGYGKDLQHRFGRFTQPPPAKEGNIRVWIQAVSVGEVLAVGPLIEALQVYGRYEIVLTTTTSTGYAEARKRYGDKILATGIFPLDFWPASICAWGRIKPDAIVLTESELWPEHLHQSKVRSVPAFLVNARLSDRSFARYQKVPHLPARLFQKFTAIFPASATDSHRLGQLGASNEQIQEFGSIKLDVPAPPLLSESARHSLLVSLGFSTDEKPMPPLLLGSSTWPGEEAALIRITARLLKDGLDCRLLLVPRHAERGPELRRLLQGQNLSWHQRSCGEATSQDIIIHLADTTGELSQLTQLADICFVGKSLAPNSGGQSPIDAAGLGKPLLFGPHMSNFRDIAADLRANGAACEVSDEADLEAKLRSLLEDPARCGEMSRAARDWHSANRGSCARIARAIDEQFQRIGAA